MQALLATTSSSTREAQDETRPDGMHRMVLEAGSSSSSSSSDSSSSSSDDEDDPAPVKADPKIEDAPLFDDVLAPPTSAAEKSQLTITINASQPLSISLPWTPDASDKPTEPPIFTYPPSCVPLKYLPEKTQQLKLARFIPCRTEGCECTGLKPPGWGTSKALEADPSPAVDAKGLANQEGSEKKSKIILWTSPSNLAVDIQGLEALDPLARTITRENLWTACGACGCRWSDDATAATGVDGEPEKKGKVGHTFAVVETSAEGSEGVDKDELQRRRRVAHRAEEMLEVCFTSRSSKRN